MKKLAVFTSIAAVLAAVGCTTMSPDKKYAADRPPPLVENSDGRTKLPTTKLSDSRKPISQEDINEDNYVDQARRLENNMAHGRPCVHASGPVAESQLAEKKSGRLMPAAFLLQIQRTDSKVAATTAEISAAAEIATTAPVPATRVAAARVAGVTAIEITARIVVVAEIA